MNRITPEALYRLLPAVHRLRDADEGEPLKALIGILAREGAVVEESIEQLFDNLFIETCADWAAPYIGGTIGYRTLYPIDGTDVGNRAEVANTIGYRRRKGTAAVLEQLARDVTGWPAHVVEYFQHVATCQHMNHIRPNHHATPGLRNPLALEPLNKAFDRTTRSIDVRSIQQSPARNSIGGKHNLPNIGLHLWRLIPVRHTLMPAKEVDTRRYLFDALGAPRQLVNNPEPETSITSLSEPRHVPGDITRRALAADIVQFYPRAFEIVVDGAIQPATKIEACDLSDDGTGWNHTPHTGDLIRVDPVLGRIAFPNENPGEVRVSYYTTFHARIGGGEYNRAETLTHRPGQTIVQYPSIDHATLQAAIDAASLTGSIVEIRSNDVFAEPLAIRVPSDNEVVLRAADGHRPILRPPSTIQLEGGPDARITLDGLTIEGAHVNIRPDSEGASLKEVTLRHCTLVPGRAFTPEGTPQTPHAASLNVVTTGLELFLDRSITGPLHLDETTNVEIRNCLVDAAAADSIDSPGAWAIHGPTGADSPAGALTVLASTIIGRITARSFPLVSNSILFAQSSGSGAPVRALRRQQGCMRFSFIPQTSITPRRYRCQPQLAIDIAKAEAGGQIDQATRDLIVTRIARWLKPSFTALSASHPAFAQLHQATPTEIREGASDEGEMGVYHLLSTPKREINLRIRLDEYLRFGLEAGIFYET